MPKGKKSSLDLEEPVVVQGNDEEPIVAVEAVKEEIEEESKAETQVKAAAINKRKGVKICVL